MIVQRSALVARPAFHLFDLIEAAEHYPAFLPWCADARIISRDDEMVSADLRLRYGGVDFEVRTRNPKRRPEYMAIHLVHGPFRRFEGEWRLTPLSLDGCRVEFRLDYEFNSVMLTRVAGPMFRHIADTMVDAFVQRSESQPVAPVGVPTAWPTAAVGAEAPSVEPSSEVTARRTDGSLQEPPTAVPTSESVPFAPAGGSAPLAPPTDSSA